MTDTKRDYVGLTLDEAWVLAKERGDTFRVTILDGQPMVMTMDHVVGRINASVKDSVVTGYSIEGVSGRLPAEAIIPPEDRPQ